MEDLLKEIGITETGEHTKYGAYVVDIKDYDEYSKYFSLLEKSSLEEVQDTAQITLHTTNVTFASDKYQVLLQADLDEDLYKLVVTEF
jgi:hypothetical protein